MTLSAKQGSPLIFLSHSGQDKDLADLVSSGIRTEFAHRGATVNVFNTSDPHYRFTEWTFAPGADWRAVASQADKTLRAYLSENLAASSAYYLLVTKNSAYADSDWVRWEIEEGTALAREHHVPFVPVLIGVSWDALPREASEFVAVRLDIYAPAVLRTELGRTIDGFLRDPEWRRAFEKGLGSKQD